MDQLALDTYGLLQFDGLDRQAQSRLRWLRADRSQKAVLEAETTGYLETVRRELRDQGVVATVLEGDVASQIIAYTEREGFDLVAMATHGRSGIGRFVMGSIAEEVVRTGKVPVFL